ncbi:MAG: hypothetical protein K1X55_14075 [Chitinophagales bacterium]|nr:hypothetical protein [Chitinophagales bacterium]
MKNIVKEGSELYYFEEDARIFLCKQPQTTSPTLLFVLLLMALLFIFNGIYWLIQGQFMGYVLTTIGLISGFIYWNGKKKGKLSPHHPDNILLIIDLQERKYLNKENQLISTFDASKLMYGFMATSSAKRLVLKTPTKEYVIANGNPFSGINKPFLQILSKYDLIT